MSKHEINEELIKLFVALGAIKVDVDAEGKVSAIFPEKQELITGTGSQPAPYISTPPPGIPKRLLDLGIIGLYMAPLPTGDYYGIGGEPITMTGTGIKYNQDKETT